jgi:hypothetical protein
MTTKTTPPPNNDAILNFLNSILKNMSDLKDVTPEEVAVLTASVKILAEEMKHIARSVELLLTAVQQQNTAISELYTVQEFVLKQLKNEVEDKLETSLSPSTPKAKKEKPN